MDEQIEDDKMEMNELTRQFNEKQQHEKEAAKTDQEKKENMDADKQISILANSM